MTHVPFRYRLCFVLAIVGVLCSGTALSAATPTPKPPPRTAGRNTPGTPYGVGIFRITNGYGIWALRPSPSAGDPTTTFVYGEQGDVPLMCDWDGNGSRTPGIFRIINGYGVWAVRNSNSTGAPDSEFLFGQPGDIPICGDWTGQGRQTVGIYRIVSGMGVFALRNSNANGNPDIFVVYGQPGDLPLAGDWTGQGKQTIGIYRGAPGSGLWLLRNSNTNGDPDINFNWGSQTPPISYPIAGDWLGDGVDRAGDFQGSPCPGCDPGGWVLKLALPSQRLDFNYGLPGDIPLAYK